MDLEKIKLTPDEWGAKFGIVVWDPDGWDRKNYEEDWAKPLTIDEYEKKAALSTCQWSTIGVPPWELMKQFKEKENNNIEIAKALEEYKAKTGVKKLHVTLGPDATPESVLTELRQVDKQIEEYENIPLHFKLEVENKILKEKLKAIGKLIKTDIRNWDKNPELDKLKSDIFEYVDMLDTIHVARTLEEWKKQNED